MQDAPSTPEPGTARPSSKSLGGSGNNATDVSRPCGSADSARCHFDVLGDELLLEVLAHGAAADLAALASTARRFCQPTVLVSETPPVAPHASKGAAVARAPDAPPEVCSLVEAAARRYVRGRATLEQERVPRRDGEPWLALMHELELLAEPVVFTDADAGVVLSDGGAVAMDCSTYMEHLPAVCGRVAMRSGRHYVEMASLQGRTAMYGVVGVNFDATYRMPAWKSQHGWMFGCYDGSLYHACTYRDWPGMQRTRVGDVVGLLLDLTAGSLTVYVNGTRLGLMVESGLRGPLYWVADLYSSSVSGISTVRVGDDRLASILAQAELPAAPAPAASVPVPPGVETVAAAGSPAPATHSAVPASPPLPPPLTLDFTPAVEEPEQQQPATPAGAVPASPVSPGPLTPEDCTVMIDTIDQGTTVAAVNCSIAQESQPGPLHTSASQDGGALPPDWFDAPMTIDPNAFYVKWLLYAFLSAGPVCGIVWNWSNHCDGVYGLSLYIDVHSDPESWNCAGNLGILGLGWAVVASFHALRQVVRVGDGALAKLKVIHGPPPAAAAAAALLLKGGGGGEGGGIAGSHDGLQLRMLSVCTRRYSSFYLFAPALPPSQAAAHLVLKPERRCVLQAEALSRLQRWRMACLVWCGIFGVIGVALLVPGLFTSYPLTAMLRFFLGVWVIVALGVVPSAWFLSLKVSEA
jgi:hypothetical protein